MHGMRDWLEHDVIIIGGGFYGCCLALFFRERYDSVMILEKERDLLMRASYRNQARVHNGYHYPRNVITALRSRVNYPRFVDDFHDAMDRTFAHVYAIARQGSKVDAQQFLQFCRQIGARVSEAPERVKRLFHEDHIEASFAVEECVFDADRLREVLKRKCEAVGIEIRYGATVRKVSQETGSRVSVTLEDGSALTAHAVWNCTYSQINTLLEQSALPRLPMKHEVTELALIDAPEDLRGFGVTVMDGPFFSVMPFPARHLHTLSHVRYTPHTWWRDTPDGEHRNAHAFLDQCDLESNYPLMVRDAQRYLPSLRSAQYRSSLFEVKTVLLENEHDDGRPILFRRDCGIKNFSVVMGGKIDNVYDMVQALETVSLPQSCLTVRRTP